MVIIMDWYFRVDSSKCTGCGACVLSCRLMGEDLLWMSKTSPYAYDDDCMYLCRDCEGHCFDACPVDAIEIGKE